MTEPAQCLGQCSHVTVLDGGTGEELLAHRGVEDDRTTWSAKAVSDSAYHDTLRGVHLDFLNSGAEYVTVNNFGCTPGVFGFDEPSLHHIRTLTRQAGEIAAEAARLVKGRKVLASLPPLVESYRPDLALKDHALAVRLYRTCIIDVLDDLVDGWIAETLSSSAEVQDALNAITETFSARRPATRAPRDLFVSMCVKRGGLVRSGEQASSAVARVIERWVATGTPDRNASVALRGVLFNCSRPEDIALALDDVCKDTRLMALLDQHEVSLGCYPNRLTLIPEGWTMEASTEPQGTRTDFDEEAFVNWALRLMEEHERVRIVGGCCGIGPSHIRALRSAVDRCQVSPTRGRV